MVMQVYDTRGSQWPGQHPFLSPWGSCPATAIPEQARATPGSTGTVGVTLKEGTIVTLRDTVQGRAHRSTGIVRTGTKLGHTQSYMQEGSWLCKYRTHPELYAGGVMVMQV